MVVLFDKEANAIKSSGNIPIVSSMYKGTRENKVSLCVSLLFITAKHFPKVISGCIFSHPYTFPEESMLTFLRISLDFSHLLCPQEVFGKGDVFDHI